MDVLGRQIPVQSKGWGLGGWRGRRVGGAGGVLTLSDA